MVHYKVKIFQPKASLAYLPDVVCYAPDYHTNTSLIGCVSFSHTGPPRWIDYLASLWEHRRKVSFQERNNTLPSSGTNREPTTLRYPTCVLIL